MPYDSDDVVLCIAWSLGVIVLRFLSHKHRYLDRQAVFVNFETLHASSCARRSRCLSVLNNLKNNEIAAHTIFHRPPRCRANSNRQPEFSI